MFEYLVRIFGFDTQQSVESQQLHSRRLRKKKRKYHGLIIGFILC